MNTLEILEQAENGEITLLDAMLELNYHKKEYENLIASIKEFQNKYLTDISLQAQEYPDGYKGYDVKLVNGRQTFNFKGIKEWSDVDTKKKELEAKYKSLYKMYQTTKERPMSEDGEVFDLPEVNYSSSYFKITKTKA